MMKKHSVRWVYTPFVKQMVNVERIVGISMILEI